MRSFSGLGLGLSLVFGCLLLALVAELYYLLWWKKKRIMADREIREEDEYGKFAKELLQLICWKAKNNNNQHDTTGNQEGKVVDPDNEQDPELGCAKDEVLLKPGVGEEGVESELMRLHNLAGPPRFLFTIKEETKEDLESEDGKSRKGSRTRSLSDLMVTLDTPFLTPLASPRLKSSSPLDSYKHHGFNPLFESYTEAELSRLRSSPPPKFKFLRDAEEKLYKRLREEAEKMASQNSDSAAVTEERDGSSFTFKVNGKNNSYNNNNNNNNNLPLYSSQVLPLASSPTTFRPDQLDQVSKKPILH